MLFPRCNIALYLTVTENRILTMMGELNTTLGGNWTVNKRFVFCFSLVFLPKGRNLNPNNRNNILRNQLNQG